MLEDTELKNRIKGKDGVMGLKDIYYMLFLFSFA
jgi:hypothetical protein